MVAGTRNNTNYYFVFCYADGAAVFLLGGVLSTGVFYVIMRHFEKERPSIFFGDQEETVEGVRITKYLGIPYAERLTSRHRFGSPRPLDYVEYLSKTKWPGSYARLGCPQVRHQQHSPVRCQKPPLSFNVGVSFASSVQRSERCKSARRLGTRARIK